MASTPRLYLFHGSDSRSSLQALVRWETLFLEKYGTATRYIIDADELSLDQVRQECTQRMQGITLFAEPKLLLIKRLEVHEKGRTAATTINALLEDLKVSSDTMSTIVCWSDRALSEKSPLLVWFNDQQAVNRAKISNYSVPSIQEVGRVAQTYLQQYGKVADSTALQWVTEQYKQQEKVQRLAGRLKVNETLPRDERAWWLYQVLDAVSLLTPGKSISVALCKQAAEEVQAVNVFEVTNAMRDGQWNRARQLLSMWEVDQDSTSFFGLWSILRVHYRVHAQKALRLLAEVEILSKNTQIPYHVLTYMLVLRLEHFAKTGTIMPIIDQHRLWLSSLPLS